MSKRLKELRLQKGMTLLQVANALGVTESTAQRYESGVIENLKYDTIVKLANLYKVTPAHLMGWDSPTMLFEAAAGEGRINDGYPTETFSIALEDDEIIVEVCGKSMEPTLVDGDKVIIREQPDVNYNGQIALVQIDGESETIKRVVRADNGLRIEGDNFNDFRPRFFSAKEVEELPVRIRGVAVRLIRDIE